jgi:hypothetical protein
MTVRWMKISGSWFKDDHGRTRFLRGVNLGGSSKLPYSPNGATHLGDGFLDHHDVSFSGRPFPLESAAEHLERLRIWGFNCLRFLITWEAIEHAGPGQYDEAYLDYVTAVLAKAGEFGFQVIIDPHQDMWSRFSGGDGAPGWTLEAAGFDLANLHATGAAFVQQMHEGPLPRMIWPTNASKLAAATMFTLFFAGNDFAPRTVVGEEPIQEYLQRHYLGAVGQVAARLCGMPHVLGYEAMNEPLAGYIGQHDLQKTFGLLQAGAAPTPFQGMLLGAGFPQEVAVWEQGLARQRNTGARLLNAAGLRAWQPDRSCVWRENGVWEIDEAGSPQLLRPSYFAAVDGQPVDFNRDYYEPFLRRFTAAMRDRHPGATLFVEPALDVEPPSLSDEEGHAVVYAPHWYDVFVLFVKAYNPFIALDAERRTVVFTPWLIRRSFSAQLRHKIDQAANALAGAPVFIGETGIAYDLRNSSAFSNGDFSLQVKALDRTIKALEENLLSYALWNYTADNDDAHGDQWNGENLSIFGLDQQVDVNDPYSGGRALAAVIRPFAFAVAGEPLRSSFDLGQRRYELQFRHDADVTAPTMIYVPHYHYEDGYRVTVSDGRVTRDQKAQVLIYHHDPLQALHTVIIEPSPAVV